MNPFPENTQDLKDNREDYIELIEEYIEDFNWSTTVKDMMKALLDTVNNPYVNNGDLDIYDLIEKSYSLIGAKINNKVVSQGEETRKNIAKHL